MDEYIDRNQAIKNAVGALKGVSHITAVDVATALEEIPTADVVPKSEVEKLVQDGTRLGQENETLKDNNEHLAVMLKEAKAEVERLQAEKDALIKNYAECMKDYASEIFAEIEEIFKKRIAFYTDMAKQSKFTEKHYAETMIKNCEIYLQEIAELKEKYSQNYAVD